MTFHKLILYACILFIVAGCAPRTRYTWNNYDNKLYQHYKNPAEYDQFVENLRGVIEEGEEAGKVPPGIYAEYGFAFYEKGNYPEAIKYFKLENDSWPESRILMAKMIQNAQMRGKRDKPSNQAFAPITPEPTIAISSESRGATK